MEITKIEAVPSAAPVPSPKGGRANYVYVKVSTDEGIVGWGESTCGALSVAKVVDEIGAVLVGRDPFRIEEHWQRLYHLWHNVRGGILQMAAISGIEIALWDIKGKALGVPVWELLGGRMRDRLWTYGRFDGDTPQLAVERALEQTGRGLTALKGDPFGHEGLFITSEAEREAIAKVKAVREAVGDNVELLIEAHGRLTPSAAIRIGKAIEEFCPFVFEEPVPPQNIDAMAKVAEAVSIPLATGERLYTKWGFLELLQKQVVAMIQPDVCHAGGISEVKKIAAMAEAYYVGLQPHNPYGPVNTLAGMQVDVCTPNFMILEGGHAEWFEQVVMDEFPKQRQGYFDVPTGPGIGIEMNEEVLRANPPVEQELPMGYDNKWPSRQEQTWG
jgi:galactonate dehydratase